MVKLDNKLDKGAVASQGAKGALMNMASAGALKLSGLAFYVIMLRLITPAEGGTYFIYLTVATVISLFGAFGMPESLARFIPFYEGAGRRENVKPLISTVLVLFILFLFVVSLVAFGARGLIFTYYNEELATLLPVTVATGISFALGLLLTSVLLGLKKFGENAFYSAALPAIKLALTLPAIYIFGPNLGAAIWATLASSILVDCALAYSVWSHVSRMPGSFKLLGVREAKELVAYGTGAAFNQLSLYAMSWTDTLVLAYFVASPLIGAYNSAMNMVRSIMQTVASQIFIVITSLLSHLHGEKSEIFGPLASNGARWSAYLTLPLAALSVLFARESMEIFFPAYSEYYWLFHILVPGLLIGVFSLPARSAISAIGRSDLLFKSTLVGLVPNVVLNFLLIPQHGIAGAAWATIASYMISELVALHYGSKYAKFSFHPLIKKAIIPVLALVAASYLSYIYLFDYSQYGWLFELAGVFLASSLGILVYITLMKFSGAFNKTDYELLAKFEKAMLRLAFP